MVSTVLMEFVVFLQSGVQEADKSMWIQREAKKDNHIQKLLVIMKLYCRKLLTNCCSTDGYARAGRGTSTNTE